MSWWHSHSFSVSSFPFSKMNLSVHAGYVALMCLKQTTGPTPGGSSQQHTVSYRHGGTDVRIIQCMLMRCFQWYAKKWPSSLSPVCSKGGVTKICLYAFCLRLHEKFCSSCLGLRSREKLPRCLAASVSKDQTLISCFLFVICTKVQMAGCHVLSHWNWGYQGNQWRHQVDYTSSQCNLRHKNDNQ